MDLPNEVVMEILSRLPLEKVGKTRLLSKYHAKASYHSYYKELVARCHSGPILDGFLLQTLQKQGGYVFSFVSPRPDSPPFDFSLDFIPGRRLRILAVAPNGLLFCETRHSNNYKKLFYSICKPSTKQWKGIPISRTRFFTKNVAMFVLRSNPLHFKILRLSREKTYSKCHLPFTYTICELFDSETWRWKRLEDVVEDCYSRSVQPHSAAVLASGCAHWKTNDETSIFAFDFHFETWSKIEIPHPLVVEYNDMMMKNNTIARWGTKLVEYEGKLGLLREFYGSTPSTELWVMDNKIWTKTYDIFGSMPMALYASDISMTCSYDNYNVVFSSLETDCRTSIKLEQRHYNKAMMIFPFLSDFEPWNFHPPPRTLKSRTMAKILRKRLRAIQDNVTILVSFSFFVTLYNYYLCTFLLETLESVLLIS